MRCCRRLSLVLLLPLLLACTAEARVTIQWSTWLGGDQLQVLTSRVEEFEKQNPDIDVEIVVFAGYANYKAKLLAMFATGTAPDVVHTPITDGPLFIDSGMLLDVTQYASRLRASNYYLGDTYTRNGRVYGGYETHVQVFPVYYNIAKFSDAGLPNPNELYARGEWTWETFREVARKLTRVGSDGVVQQYGVHLPSASWQLTWGLLGLSYGAEFVDTTRTQVTMNTPAMTEAMEYLVGLYTEDSVAPRPGQALPQGDPLEWAAMQINSSNRMSTYKASFGDRLAWDIAPTPRGRDARVPRMPGADGLVLATTRHPEEAWRLVEFFLGDYVQLQKAESKLEVPILKRAVSSKTYLAPPPANMRVVGELLERSVGPPLFVGFSEVQTAAQQQLNQAFAGKVALATALEQAQRLGQAKMADFLPQR